MSFISGVVQEVASGVFAGATNFTEYALGAFPKPGLTNYGSQPNTHSREIIDGNDPEIEKNELEMVAITGNNIARAGTGVDAFDGFGVPIETLARIRVRGAAADNNSVDGGPMILMSGSLAGGFARAVGVQYRHFGTTINGCFQEGGSVQPFGSPQAVAPAPALGEYIWIRARFSPVVLTNRIFVEASGWTGALEDEPGAFMMGVEFVVPTDGIIGAMGWGGINLVGAGFDSTAKRMSFFSFTTDPDPDTNPPPTPSEVLSPGDIIPPEVTVTNLQGTYVEVAGSSFQVVS